MVKSQVERLLDMRLQPDLKTEQFMKCCICIDRLLMASDSIETAADAITYAPVPQVLQVDGSVVGGVVAVPVCGDCRKRQLGVKSKTGLIAA